MQPINAEQQNVMELFVSICHGRQNGGDEGEGTSQSSDFERGLDHEPSWKVRICQRSFGPMTLRAREVSLTMRRVALPKTSAKCRKGVTP